MDARADRRRSNALASLQALSVGDAFGEMFFDAPRRVDAMLSTRTAPAGQWSITDDTAMAMSIVDVLVEHGRIEQDLLAELFAARYRLSPWRGYGGTAHRILMRIGAGTHWREASGDAFDGMGSMGNGGAMRAAPIGAWFFDDPARAAEEARLSAEVTHAHREGQAGAMAVAAIAAWVAGGGADSRDLFACALDLTPAGETRAGIERASRLDLDYDVRTAVAALGNGSGVVSQDTVPFCLWSAARNLGKGFEEAMWSTVAGLGDRDTTCAIVAGMLALHPAATIPEAWLAAREPLDVLSRERVQGAARDTDRAD